MFHLFLKVIISEWSAVSGTPPKQGPACTWDGANLMRKIVSRGRSLGCPGIRTETPKAWQGSRGALNQRLGSPHGAWPAAVLAPAGDSSQPPISWATRHGQDRDAQKKNHILLSPNSKRKKLLHSRLCFPGLETKRCF